MVTINGNDHMKFEVLKNLKLDLITDHAKHFVFYYFIL